MTIYDRYLLTRFAGVFATFFVAAFAISWAAWLPQVLDSTGVSDLPDAVGILGILGPFGPDCRLRRTGLKLAERGGPQAKKKAVVAVARKLAVLMLVLWRDEQVYKPKNRAA